MIFAGAALETLLLAALALIGARVHRGHGMVDLLLRLNDLLVRPFGALPGLAAPTATGVVIRQFAAIAAYGAVCLLCAGIIAWFDRRRRLY